MEDLIKLLEESEFGDEELDMQIAQLFGEISWRKQERVGKPDGWYVVQYGPHHPFSGVKEPVPRYTTSMDSALRLFEKTAAHHLWSLWDAIGSYVCRVSFSGGGWMEDKEISKSTAKTAPLAMCAAFLKSRKPTA